MKSWLINTLMQITAQDDLISKDEYAMLMIIAKEFFPNNTFVKLLIFLDKSHFILKDTCEETKIKSNKSFAILFVYVDWCPYCISAKDIIIDLRNELKKFNLFVFATRIILWQFCLFTVNPNVLSRSCWCMVIRIRSKFANILKLFKRVVGNKNYSKMA